MASEWQTVGNAKKSKKPDMVSHVKQGLTCDFSSASFASPAFNLNINSNKIPVKPVSSIIKYTDEQIFIKIL